MRCGNFYGRGKIIRFKNSTAMGLNISNAEKGIGELVPGNGKEWKSNHISADLLFSCVEFRAVRAWLPPLAGPPCKSEIRRRKS